jgi:hypothetical protein
MANVHVHPERGCLCDDDACPTLLAGRDKARYDRAVNVFTGALVFALTVMVFALVPDALAALALCAAVWAFGPCLAAHLRAGGEARAENLL